MKDLFAPLTEHELDQLDHFLLDRLDEDEAAEDKDEGILNIAELDGFMTAMVSGPVMVPPSRWLPAVWGDFEPVWETTAQFEEILALMMRHMNSVSGMLRAAPDEFEPLFMEREVDGRVYRIVDEWCEGYLRGMRLDLSDWSSTENFSHLLGLMLLFASDEGFEKLRQFTIEEVEEYQDLITPAVRQAHAYWLGQRSDKRTVRHEGAKTGRNDPCPCGSGQKFKKCCGAKTTLH